MEEALADFLRHLALEKNASELTVKSYREDLSQAAEFLNAYKSREYEIQINIFRRAAETVSKKAKDKNLDGVTLAYVDMTMTCLKCHQHTRDPKADPDGAAAAATRPRPPIDDEITAVLAATGAKRIVVAHTPSLAGIQMTNGGRLVRVDTGISRYYGGSLSWLEIVGDRITPHTTERPSQ